MADTPSPLTREELTQQLKHLITLSIGLKFEQKGELIGRLESLSDAQLQQLVQVFEQEKARKEQLLSDFFQKNPQLYQEFERFSQHHVDQIYREVEEGELSQEQQQMENLLQTTF